MAHMLIRIIPIYYASLMQNSYHFLDKLIY